MYTDNQRQIIVEALRQSELQLEDLQASVTATEARALHFAGACLLIATIAVATGNPTQNSTVGNVVFVGLVAAVFIAIYSAFPRRFHIRGHRWEDWKGHVADDDCFYDVLISQANENDDRIAFNNSVLERTATVFTISFSVAFLSVFCLAIGRFGTL